MRETTRPAMGRLLRSMLVGAALVSSVPLAAACGSASAGGAGRDGVVSIVAAENQYASVAAQIGGRYARVVSIESNPSADPHGYEVSPDVAREVGGAGLVVQNGLGYDGFMDRLEAATPSSRRRVVVAARVRRLSPDTPNPHLWYDPATMPAVARAVARDLGALSPAHAAYFGANLRAFEDSLGRWRAAIAGFRARRPGATAATTEPVADYLLAAMGIRNLTPLRFQADVMNGTDPAPQDVALEEHLFASRAVDLLVYNEQVSSPLTESIRADARRAGIPVVGASETMPAGGDFQSWMVSETLAVERAVEAGRAARARSQ